MSDSSVVTTASARALASRRNGARSRGPKTAAGKARSARNALKHGLCALKFLVLPEEDAVEFRALEAALLGELAPVGSLQAVLAQRVVSAAWRLARADRMEAEVLAWRRWHEGGLGLAVIRDGNGTNSFATVMRYRNAALAELMRARRPPGAPGRHPDRRPARAPRPPPRPTSPRATKRTRQSPPDQRVGPRGPGRCAARPARAPRARPGAVPDRPTRGETDAGSGAEATPRPAGARPLASHRSRSARRA